MRFAWIDEPPFGYATADGPAGSDVELARLAFARVGWRFEPVHATFADLLPGLHDGRWDVTVGMFVTTERAALARFTRPIWALSDGLLVRREHAHVTGYTDLARAGMTVAVLGGQVQEGHALRLGVEPGRLVVLDTYPDGAAAVADGRADAYATAAPAHEDYLRSLAAAERAALVCVRVPDDEVPAAPGAFACASEEVRAELDTALAAVAVSPVAYG